MRYLLKHTTTYGYEAPVSHGRHVIRKRPRALPFQEVVRSKLTVEPEAVWSARMVDYFANAVDLVEVIEPHDSLVVTVESVVDVGPREFDIALPVFQTNWETARDRLARSTDLLDAREFTFASPHVPRSQLGIGFASRIFSPGRPLLESVIDLNRTIHETFAYDPRFSDVATPLDRVLTERRGVCQDFAHVAVSALRSMGLAARYVSGYLETIPPPGKPRLVGADASHAWASVYVPDHGWIDLDPTNGVLPGQRHIVVGWGRDFSDVSPLRGVVLGGGSHTVTVGVDLVSEATAQAAAAAAATVVTQAQAQAQGAATPSR